MEDHHHHKNEEECHHNHLTNKSVTQTLSEMDFERGIWNAVIYNEIDRVKEFIRKGETNLTDNYGYTALHYASRNGNEEICKLLINANANVNAKTNSGCVTSLHRAVMMGHLKIIEQLITAGAQIDIQDNDGKTALHKSAEKQNLKISKLLLCKYNNKEQLKLIKDKNNKIPFDYVKNDNYELKLLLQPSEGV